VTLVFVNVGNSRFFEDAASTPQVLNLLLERMNYRGVKAEPCGSTESSRLDHALLLVYNVRQV